MSDVVVICLFVGFLLCYFSIFLVLAVKFKIAKRKEKKLTDKEFDEKLSQNKKIAEMEKILTDKNFDSKEKELDKYEFKD